MQLAQDLTSAVLALRRKVNIKVRQPLSRLLVPVSTPLMRARVEAMAALVAAEINVKELQIVNPEESNLVKRVKADFKKLGPRFGKIMKQLGAAIKDMSQAEIATLEANGSFKFEALPGAPEITVDDVEILAEDIPGWVVGGAGDLTVALDVEITPELRAEGFARELVNRIQNIRKDSDFDITDKVDVTLQRTPLTEAALASFEEYIAAQVLARDIRLAESGEITGSRVLDIDEEKVAVKVTRV